MPVPFQKLGGSVLGQNPALGRGEGWRQPGLAKAARGRARGSAYIRGDSKGPGTDVPPSRGRFLGLIAFALSQFSLRPSPLNRPWAIDMETSQNRARTAAPPRV